MKQDRIKQEKRKREKTLAGIFIKYAAVFCINTLVILGAVFLIFNILVLTKVVLPANYAEQYLQNAEGEISRAEQVTDDLIPEGSTYGVYRNDGKWLYGNLSPQEREQAWDMYREKNMYKRNGGYYYFIERKVGEVCIVQYIIRTRFVGQTWEGRYVNPETILPMLFVVLFLIQAWVLARAFAGQLKQRLHMLHEVTEKIGENTLEFEETHSDIKEIEEVLQSLNHMKNALQKSLKEQWEMERQREEQLAALAHDIKTPLTVIRGNVELLAEDLNGEDECHTVILRNISEIESYLELMRHVLHHEEKKKKTERFSCQDIAEELEIRAVQLASSQKMKVTVRKTEIAGELLIKREQILRAWENLLSNALEYTKSEYGIAVEIRCEVCGAEKMHYMTAKVSDYGPGFGEKDLRHATEAFYRGDASRHDRSHQGLGLSIAYEMAEEQGGFLSIGNSEETGGAETVLGLRCI